MRNDERSQHRNRTTVLTPIVPPSTRCRPSSSSGVAEMIWQISATMKHLIKKASPALLSLQHRRQDSGSRTENVREFSSSARIRLHDCFRNARGQCRRMIYSIYFQSFLLKVVHILAVILATSQCSAERSFSVLRSSTSAAPWGNKRVSNIALINTERTYANSVVNNDMGHVIDIFGHRNGRDSYFF